MEARPITLTLPAEGNYALLARMTLSGLGMLAGLELGLIDDLRSTVDESCDCLLHQPERASALRLEAAISAGRLRCRIEAEGSGEASGEAALDPDVTRGILETLMPDVELTFSERGVRAIAFSLPVAEAL